MSSNSKKYTITIVLLTIVAFAADWLHTRSFTVYLDDARIKSNIISISSKKPGWIVKLSVSTGDTISSDQILVEIDSRNDKLALKAFDLQILSQQLIIDKAKTQREIIAQRTDSSYTGEQAQLQQAIAARAKASSVLEIAHANFNRSKSMWDKNLISQQRLDDASLTLTKATHAYTQEKASVKGQQSRLLSAKANLQELTIHDTTLAILQQEMNLLKVKHEKQQIALNDNQIKSPIANAVIDKTFAHLGEFAIPGYRLLMLHDHKTSG